MAAIDPKIFKKYDIRGLATGPDALVTPQAARLAGQAFGSYLRETENKTLVVAGRDNRITSPDLSAAAVAGLQASGCDVIDIGLVSTPVVYWQAVKRDDAGAVMITASHLPPDQNGLKLSVGKRSLYGETLQTLRKRIESGQLASGSGTVAFDATAGERYFEDLRARLTMARRLHVVIDPGNGTGGLFGPRLFKAWGHQVTCIFCDLDGNYPNHQPDPQKPQYMQALSAAVRERGADLGIAFDGDADRMGAVDETGEVIVADRLLALLARDMLARRPGETVVADVLSSQVLFDEVARAGGKPVLWASGHSLIKAKMAELGSLLGGEMSGHIFMGEDFYGFDDGCMAAGRLLQLLARGDQSLSQLNASMPTLFSTPEIRPHCPDEDKQAVIAGVQELLADKGEVVAVDGIRIKFERGWGLLRASNTEPVLSLRFEGETEADAWAYHDMFAEALARFPQVAPLR